MLEAPEPAGRLRTFWQEDKVGEMQAGDGGLEAESVCVRMDTSSHVVACFVYCCIATYTAVSDTNQFLLNGCQGRKIRER